MLDLSWQLEAQTYMVKSTEVHPSFSHALTNTAGHSHAHTHSA